MTTTAIETDDVVLCTRCLCAKPASEFRRRRKGEPRRQRTCRGCHTSVERERRALQRSQQDQATVRRFACDVKAAPTNQHIGLLVAVIEQKLGGPQRLAKEWLTHFHAARLKHGSRRVLDFLASVARLSVAAAELNPKPKFDEMTDEELRDAQDRLLADHFHRNLPTFLGVLVEQGWGITPPPDSETAPDESNAVSTTARSLV